VALGHIHRHQVLNENPPVVYSGSLERLDFGDEDDEKGFYLVEIEHTEQKKWTSFEFRGLGGRRFLTVKVELAPEETDPTGAVLEALEISRGEICGNIVRLEISLPQAFEGMLDESLIRQECGEAYYFSIVKNAKRQTRTRLGDTSVESLSPTEALKNFIAIKHKDYSKANAEKLTEYGANIIRGGEDS
jgi:exonuclease SbcD